MPDLAGSTDVYRTSPKGELSHTLETTLSKDRPGLYVTDMGTLTLQPKQANLVIIPRKTGMG